MNRNKLKSLAACFVLMLVFITISGIAAAATADSDEQMTDGGGYYDAQHWSNYMGQKGYSTVYNYKDSKSAVTGRIPSDTIWMFSGHGGDLGGFGATRLYLGDPYIWYSYILGADVPTNSIKLAYADACKSSVQHWDTDDVSQGFISKGTTTYIGFNRDVWNYETGPFTNDFASSLVAGSTVYDAASFASANTPSLQGSYTIYGNSLIKI